MAEQGGHHKLYQMKTAYLKEPNGQHSSTRLIFFIGSIWVMGICTYLVITHSIEAGGLVAVFGSLEGVFVGLKLGQKPMENKKPTNG